ncbi:site-specific integrase [uncultured Brachyspira sp.]|uniref:tyrosine-type recombinase/integrase n=1 Tax=uncultured Brachyspira sp. TaxID=221953 RepID=UPI0026224A1F|nr:site-specific integrase [uncultured Brachyspira sp.]
MPTLKKTKFNGVYYRDSDKRKFQGKPDRCFYIKYYYDGKQYNKRIGWLSDGYTAQLVANIKADKIKEITEKEEQIEKPKEYTFNDLFEIFMLWAKQNKKSWKIDQSLYNNYIKAFIGGINIKNISHADINNMLLTIKGNGKKDGKPYAPQTIKHILILTKRVFNFNIDMGNCETNPADKVKLEKFDNTRIAYLLDDEIERIFKYLDSGREWYGDVALIKFALYTGLRRGELFNLIWDNVDLENNRITLYDTKGGKNQSIILASDAAAVLQSLSRTDTYVFPSKLGGKRDDVKKLWSRIKLAANIRPNIRFHDIRHTFGTIAVSSGIGIDVVQKMMTHKDIKTTQRYAHIVDQRMKDAANTINSAFNILTNKNKDTNEHNN